MARTARLAMALVAAMTVQAGQTKKERVIVYIQNDANAPEQVTNRAKELAASMFTPIGVAIDWRLGALPASSAQHAIAIRLAGKTPKDEKPGALAYAMPHEGVHIVVFWDRIEFGIFPTELLAHVMAHEITHILEGVCRHSETGIMRAQWTERDHKMMRTHPLSFAPEDVELIHLGMAARMSSSGVELAFARPSPAYNGTR